VTKVQAPILGSVGAKNGEVWEKNTPSSQGKGHPLQKIFNVWTSKWLVLVL